MLVSNHKPLMFDRFDMEKMIVSYCIYMIPNGTVANRLSNQIQGILKRLGVIGVGGSSLEVSGKTTEAAEDAPTFHGVVLGPRRDLKTLVM